MSKESPNPIAPPTSSTSDDLTHYQIGEVANRTGLTQRTLRFYEEKGLLQPPARMDGGFRLYSDEDIDRVHQIKNLQTLLGLSLAEIKEMVDAEQILGTIRATSRESRNLTDRKKRLQKAHTALRSQLDIVDRKIRQLTDMHTDLGERLRTVTERSTEIDQALRKTDIHAN